MAAHSEGGAGDLPKVHLAGQVKPVVDGPQVRTPPMEPSTVIKEASPRGHQGEDLKGPSVGRKNGEVQPLICAAVSRQNIALLHPRTTFCEQTVESIPGRRAGEKQTGKTSIEKKAKAQSRDKSVIAGGVVSDEGGCVMDCAQPSGTGCNPPSGNGCHPPFSDEQLFSVILSRQCIDVSDCKYWDDFGLPLGYQQSDSSDL